MSTTGKVRIHGREYKTVALRVAEFREQYPASDGWAIITEIISRDEQCVVVKASIWKDNKPHSGSGVVATGFAEEMRAASQINKTSALENCETSAIGRALAAFGLGGSEYASANEVANAIHQQNTPSRQQPKQQPRSQHESAQQARLTADEIGFVTRATKGLETADATDLETIGADIKGRSLAVQNALDVPFRTRQTFLKESQNVKSDKRPQPKAPAEVAPESV